MIVRALSVLMFAVFVYAAVVQYNDPDPWLWIVLYGAAAGCCALHAAGVLPRWVPAVLGGVYALGILYLLLRLFGGVGVLDRSKMMGLTEEARELLGLLIMAVWMGILVWQMRGARARTPSPDGS